MRRNRAARRVPVIRAISLILESSRSLLKHPDIIRGGATSDLTTAQKEITRPPPDTIQFKKTDGRILADVVEIPELENQDMRNISLGLDNNKTSL